MYQRLPCAQQQRLCLHVPDLSNLCLVHDGMDCGAFWRREFYLVPESYLVVHFPLPCVTDVAAYLIKCGCTCKQYGLITCACVFVWVPHVNHMSRLIT
jgi:hypothetical protein